MAARGGGGGHHYHRQRLDGGPAIASYRQNPQEPHVNPQSQERLFGYRHAFDSPLVLGLTIAVAAILALTPLIFFALDKSGKLNDKLRGELWARYFSWLILAPLMIVPVLLGAFWTILAVGILSLLCFREYARATGLFRERAISLVVVLGIVMLTFTALDHWYGFFTALSPLTVGLIALVAILPDQPKGYIQRVGLAVLGFMLFGTCLGHLAYFANDPNYRQIIFWLIVCVEMNDIFAFCCGKTFGHRKLAPNTSPNKTLGGALGAIILTTALAAGLSLIVFLGTVLSTWQHALLLGLMISVLGIFGDLLLSSVKRDLGIKDMAATLPGHGGVLDRFNSLLLVSPAVFHYVGYFLGVGLTEPTRVFSGLW
jgi:phosphatidate cytidylyltransferase